MSSTDGTTWIEDSLTLLAVKEMYRAEADWASAGGSMRDLMEVAGAAVADTVQDIAPDGPVAVLCGPGNNGGDGFVAARLLAEAGREVRVALLGDRDALKGDAAANAERWTGPVVPLERAMAEAVAGAGVVVDAIFGAGLARPVEGAAAEVLAAVDALGLPCVAVDVPSGVDGDSGQVRGVALHADVTVTFFRRKPGHLLYPGRARCGAVRVADIGIPAARLDEIGARQWENAPALWWPDFPRPDPEGHKFDRGHSVVAGGAVMTGAARLASHAALRAGAGLVTIAAHPEAGVVYRSGHPSVMVADVPELADFRAVIDDARVRAVLVGPGAGRGPETRGRVEAALSGSRAVVLDADALNVFAGEAEDLAARIAASDGACVLTPHDGEFARLFADAAPDASKGRLTRARVGAAMSGAVVVLKGADTVIADPDGRAAINANAPADLATAGSGDVLSGIIAGLLAQGMPAFEAACAGVWLHGAAGAAFGPGLIAEDIARMLPGVLRDLRG